MRKPVRAQGKVEARIDRMGGRGGGEGTKGKELPCGTISRTGAVQS